MLPDGILRRSAVGVAIALLVAALWPFAWHAVDFGRTGLLGAPPDQDRFMILGRPVGNVGIYLHMLTGGVLTLLVPVQIWSLPRRWAPRLHRIMGRLLLGLAAVTGVGGLVYIGSRGTIGGPVMSAGFALYGSLMLCAAVQALRFARARDFARHRRWGLRLAVLALGSWLYRVHYGLWYAATGGAASNANFTGTFDIVQTVAFYLPYLLALELWFLRERRSQGERSTQTSL